MNYPYNLVPKPKQIIIKKLNPKHHVCRWVSEFVELKDLEGKLNPEAVETKRIYNLSVNKIPYSKIEDIFINVVDTEYHKEWEEGNPGKEIPEESYTLESNRKYYLLKIKDIIGIKEKFPYPVNSDEESYTFEINIKHSPTIANYYHCEMIFNFYDPDGNIFELKESSKSWKKKITFKVREIIIENAIFDLE